MKIILSKVAHAKIISMLTAVTTEVGALMTGYIVPDSRDIYITNIYITEQVVSGADVDFTEKGVDEATMEAIMNGEVVVGWVHSHGLMKQFWSGTDEKAIDKLLAHTESWLVSIVGNNACAMTGRIDYYTSSVFGSERIKVNDVSIVLEPEITQDIKDEIAAAIEVSVKTRPAASGYFRGGKYTVYKGAGRPEDAFTEEEFWNWGIPGTAYQRNRDSGKTKASGSSKDVPAKSNADVARQNLIDFYKEEGLSEDEATKLVDDEGSEMV